MGEAFIVAVILRATCGTLALITLGLNLNRSLKHRGEVFLHKDTKGPETLFGKAEQ